MSKIFAGNQFELLQLLQLEWNSFENCVLQHLHILLAPLQRFVVLRQVVPALL